MIRRRSCTWMSLTRSRSSSLACSGFSSATIASSCSARLARAAPSGGVCACVARRAVRSASRSRSVSRRSRWPRTRSWKRSAPSVFEALEVAFQFALDACDLGARRCELLLQLGTFALGRTRQVGEGLLDDAPIAVEVGELGEDGGFEAALGQPVAGAFGGAAFVAGGARVVGVAAVAAVRGRAAARARLRPTPGFRTSLRRR